MITGYINLTPAVVNLHFTGRGLVSYLAAPSIVLQVKSCMTQCVKQL